MSGAEGTFAGATVWLYKDSGNSVIDGGESLVGSATTDASGNYGFIGLANGTYYVVVDSKTLKAPAYNTGSNIGNVWAEETYAVSGAATGTASTLADFTGSDGALYGGRRATTSDNAVALGTAEHIIRRTLTGADKANVDFGFSFNVVTNTLGGDNQDDDATASRTVQGSLRQFIQNADAITGANAMRFVPASGVATKERKAVKSKGPISVSDTSPGPTSPRNNRGL